MSFVYFGKAGTIAKFNSFFRVDQIVAALKFKPAQLEGVPLSFMAAREPEMAELIQKDELDKRCFRYASLDKKENYYRMQLEAKSIAGNIPIRPWRFPTWRSSDRVSRLWNWTRRL